MPTESGDVKATIAVLGFILSSAAKHNVDSESLASELQQLGLPKGRWRGTGPLPRGGGCSSGVRPGARWVSPLVSPPLRRARRRAVPLLRGEAELLAGEPEGLQPEA